jgi:hypothetical protein
VRPRDDEDDDEDSDDDFATSERKPSTQHLYLGCTPFVVAVSIVVVVVVRGGGVDPGSTDKDDVEYRHLPLCLVSLIIPSREVAFQELILRRVSRQTKMTSSR